MGAHITEDVTFGDIWAKRKTFTLLPMEEGVLQDWHWGRFAVVGDAAHKVSFATKDLFDSELKKYFNR